MRPLRYIGPALLFCAAILAWQGIASTDWFDDLTLASPTEVAHSLVSDRSLLFDSLWTTFTEVAVGLAFAVAAGALTAVGMHVWRPLHEAAYPLLVGSQAIPVVIVAPLFIIAFDYGLWPKVAIVALVCFFPVTVNLMDGLRSVAPEQLKLMRSLGASRLQTLWKVELPSALPSLFSGLKIAATVSVIGAVFGEAAGAESGLGYLVLLDNHQLETPRAYAGVVLLAALAVALFLLTALAERFAVPWNRREGDPAA
jgi:NitT/TauT family transport system permease protein/putative hydroxymethylpyrimidine transport system permease protein